MLWSPSIHSLMNTQLLRFYNYASCLQVSFKDGIHCIQYCIVNDIKYVWVVWCIMVKL